MVEPVIEWECKGGRARTAVVNFGRCAQKLEADPGVLAVALAVEIASQHEGAVSSTLCVSSRLSRGGRVLFLKGTWSRASLRAALERCVSAGEKCRIEHLEYYHCDEFKPNFFPEFLDEKRLEEKKC